MVLRPHRIRRERFVVTASSQSEAFALRARLRERMSVELAPALERALDAHDAGGVVRIPRVAVRLHVASVDAIDGAFACALEEELALALREALSDARGSDPAARERVAEAVAFQAALARWIARGELPWALRGASFGESELRELARAETTRDVRALHAAARAEAGGALAAPAWRRWLALLDSTGRAALSRALLASTQADIADAIEAERARGALSDHPALELAAEWLALASSRPAQAEASLQEAIERLLEGALRDRIEAALARARNNSMPTLRRDDGARSSPIQSEAEAAGARAVDALDGPREAAALPAERSELDPARPARALAARPPTDGGADAALPVRHAGLVLLHPYLARLFEALGYWRLGESTLREDVALRAHALLSYAASEREDELCLDPGVLNLLAGRPLDAPVELAAGLLTREEREEADALLDAVTEHWRALGRSSRGALRTTFLQRRGWLRDADDGLTLQVEGSGVDVLLARLPWALSLVKLPWTRRALFVRWEAP